MSNKPLDFVLGLPRKLRERLYASFDEIEDGVLPEDIDLNAAIERKLNEVFDPVSKNYNEAIFSVLEAYQSAQGVQDWLINFAIQNEDPGWAKYWETANPEVMEKWMSIHDKSKNWYNGQEVKPTMDDLVLDIAADLLSRGTDMLFYEYDENKEDTIDKRNFIMEMSRLVKTPVLRSKYGDLGQQFINGLEKYDQNIINMIDEKMGEVGDTNRPSIITDEDLSLVEDDSKIIDPELEPEDEAEVEHIVDLSIQSLSHAISNISKDNPNVKISQNAGTGEKEANILGIVTIPVQDFVDPETGETSLEPAINSDLLLDTFKVFDYARKKELKDENYGYGNAYMEIFDEFYKSSFRTVEQLTRQSGEIGKDIRREIIENKKTFEELMTQKPHIQKALNDFKFYNGFSADIFGMYQHWRLGGKLTGSSIDLIMDRAHELIEGEGLEGNNLLDSFSTKGVLNDVVSEVMSLEEARGVTKEQILGILQDEFQNEFVGYFNDKREYNKLYAEQSEMLQFSKNVNGVKRSSYCRTCGKFRRGDPGEGDYQSSSDEFKSFWSEGGSHGYYWNEIGRDPEITEFNEQDMLSVSPENRRKLMTGCIYQDGIPQCDPVPNLHMPIKSISAPISYKRNFVPIKLGGQSVVINIASTKYKTFSNEELLGHPSYQHFLDKSYLDLINPEYNPEFANNQQDVLYTINEIIKVSGKINIGAWSSMSVIPKEAVLEEDMNSLAELGEKLFYYFVNIRMKKDGMSEIDAMKEADRDVNHFVVPDAGSNSMFNKTFRELSEYGEYLPSVESKLPFTYFTDNIEDLPIDPSLKDKFSVISDPQFQNKIVFGNRMKEISKFVLQMLLRRELWGVNEDEIVEIAEVILEGNNFNFGLQEDSLEKLFVDDMLGGRRIILPKTITEDLQDLRKIKDKEEKLNFVREWQNKNKTIEMDPENIENLQWRYLLGFNLSADKLRDMTQNIIEEMEQSLIADKAIGGGKGRAFPFIKSFMEEKGTEYELLDPDIMAKVYGMFIKSGEKIGMKEKIQQAEKIKNINLQNENIDQNQKDAAVDEFKETVNSIVTEAIKGVVPMIAGRVKNVQEASVYYYVRDAIMERINTGIKDRGAKKVAEDFGSSEIVDSFIQEGGKTLKENLFFFNAFIDVASENPSLDPEKVLQKVCERRGSILGVNPEKDKELANIITNVLFRRDLERLIITRPDLVVEDENGERKLILDLLIGRSIKDKGGYHQFIPVKTEFVQKIENLFNENPDYQEFLLNRLSDPSREGDEILQALQKDYQEKFMGENLDPLVLKKAPQISPQTSFRGKLPENEIYDTSLPTVSHEESPKQHEERADILRRGAPADVDAYVKFLSLPKKASDFVYDIMSAGNGEFLNSRTLQIVSGLALGYLMNPANSEEVHIQDIDMLRSNVMTGGLTNRERSLSGFTSRIMKTDEEDERKMRKKRKKTTGPSMRYYLGKNYRERIWGGTNIPINMGADIGVVKAESQISWYKTASPKKDIKTNISKKESWYKVADKKKNSSFAYVLVTSAIDGFNMARNAAANSRKSRFEKKVRPVFMLIPFSKFNGLTDVYKFSINSPFDVKIISEKEFQLYEKMGLIDRSQLQNA